MKTTTNISLAWIALAIPFLLLSCKKESDLSPGSYLSTTPPTRNALDSWLLDNFTKPYNIDVVYRWTESLVDRSRYLYPPLIDSVQPAMSIVKKLWVDPYSSIADSNLVRKVAPRQIVLVGGRNVNPSGTITLGLAEGGKRISLFEIDLLNKKSREAITQFIHTIQHEYVHILNQTKPFDEKRYGQITPSGYTAQWYDEDLNTSQAAGFITLYSRSNEREDFAEMASTMLELSSDEWNKLLKEIPDAGRSKIKEKEQIVVEYYKSEYGIDFYQLQETVYQAILKL